MSNTRQNICETAKDDKLGKIKLCNKNDAQNILKVTFKQVLNNIQLFTICIYVCMYVFIYIYIYTNKYTDTYFKLHIHIHLCICRYINKTMKGSAEKHIRLKAILLYCFFSLVWCWRSGEAEWRGSQHNYMISYFSPHCFTTIHTLTHSTLSLPHIYLWLTCSFTLQNRHSWLTGTL